MSQSTSVLFVCLALLTVMSAVHAGDDAALRKAVIFYASFDDKVAGDVGGALELSTRYNDPKVKGQYIVKQGFPKDVFRIAKGKGVSGNCLEAVDVLPDNGRVFFPGKGNLPFKKGGWSGALSVWINTDPNKLLKTSFCDPIQITQKGANNGGLWFDFNNEKPRDMRMGAFPAVLEGQKGAAESDPDAPMVKVSAVPFKQGDWHHIVMTWDNLDAPRVDARAVLYIDGKMIGAVEKRPLAMDWDIDKAGIYVAVNYIGLLDELAIFNRALTSAEVSQLQKTPALVHELTKRK